MNQGRNIRAAISGAGWIAEKAYVPCALALPRFEVALVYDPDKVRAERVAHLAGAEVANSFEACLAPDIDAVLLCAPPYQRAAQLRQCLSQGKYVLAEKPVLRTRAEAEALSTLPVVALARLMGSAAVRHRRDVQALIQHVRAGRIGTLRKISLLWSRERGVPSPGSWRTDHELSPSGVLEDLAPHLLDVAASLIDEDPWAPKRVRMAELRCRSGDAPQSATWFGGEFGNAYKVPDFARAALEVGSGITMEIEVAWTSSENGDFVRIVCEGTGGTAEFAGLVGFSPVRRIKEQYCLLQERAGAPMFEHFESGPTSQMAAFRRLMEIFRGVCVGEEMPSANSAEVLRSVLWMEAIHRAAARVERPSPEADSSLSAGRVD